MAMDELLEGTSLTGKQAAMIFLAFLSLIIVAGLLLITFSDFFRNLVMSYDATDLASMSYDATDLASGIRAGTLAFVGGRPFVGLEDG